ncbi:uncharacterized protein LOC143365703 [Halictus rubicundus]|uniref:uncharacterized protein LOC143365703 n=1 Tax=Halictus rubicundus TaxID=77578 RepID=UPI004036A338
MCDIRSWVSKLFCHSCSMSNNNTMQSNSYETLVEDAVVDGVVIEAPENTNKRIHEKCQIVIDNDIKVLDNGTIKCKLCKCVLPSKDHILLHIEGKQHERALNQSKQQENNLKLLENTTCSKEDKQTLPKHGNVLKNNKFYCKICKKNMGAMNNYLQHIKGKHHVIQLKKNQRKNLKCNDNVDDIDIDQLTLENIVEELKDKAEHYEEIQTSIYDCELCSERMNINDLFAHINTHHRDNQSLNSAGDTFLYKCVCCKSIIDGDTSFICHIRKKTHLHNFKNILVHTKAQNTETHATNDSRNTSEDNNSFVFTILSPKVVNTSVHFEEKCLISFDNIHYSCSICREKLSNTQSVIVHCQTRLHRLTIKQLFSADKVASDDNVICSILNGLHKLSIIDNDNTFQSSDASDKGLIMSNAVYMQIMEKIKETPLLPFPKIENKRCIVKPIKKRLTDRLNKLYHMEYFELEKEMYTLTEEKINEIKLYFKFFIHHDTHVYCIPCKTNVSKDLYVLYQHTRLFSHKEKVKIQTNNNTITEQYVRIDILKDEKESNQESSKKAKKVVTCEVCKVPIKNVNNIMPHIRCIEHKQNHTKNNDFVHITVDYILKDFSDLYYSIQRFTCVECKKGIRYKIEFLEHICQSHKDVLKKGNYMFDFCIPCATLWFSKSDEYEGHCNDIVHKYLLKSNDFMVETLPKCIRDMLTQIVHTIKILLKETASSTEDRVQEEVRESLETKAKLYYSKAKAFLFGSRLIGLGFTNSDIDIYIDSGNNYYENNYKVEEQLLHIKEAVATDEDVWEIKDILQECRVPIIKLIYKPRNLDCDVSFMNGLSVEKSKLLRSFNNACLPCKKLTLFVKKWLSFINLPGGHGFINYALYWLVIYYLQEKQHLPSVAELIKENNSSEFIGDWQIGFASAKCKNNHVHSVTVLLQEFFEFYANFDYQRYIVCPLMGSLIAKTDFTELNKLPTAMNAYAMHLRTSSKREFLRTDSPLCVQDPLELSQNLTKGVSSITLKYFRQYCKECAAILKIKVN